MAGLRTHLESAEIIIEKAVRDPQSYSFSVLLEKAENRNAFYSGCIFPDWGFRGINHDASEESHWRPFCSLFAEFIKDEKYIKSYIEFERGSRELYVSFLLGIILHNYVDEPWHFNTGSEDGFLRQAFEKDSISHGVCEFACDLFLFRARGAVDWEVWYPEMLITDVYRQLNFSVKASDLGKGYGKMEKELNRYRRLSGPLWHMLKRKYPWTYGNYRSNGRSFERSSIIAAGIMDAEYLSLCG